MQNAAARVRKLSRNLHKINPEQLVDTPQGRNGINLIKLSRIMPNSVYASSKLCQTNVTSNGISNGYYV